MRYLCFFCLLAPVTWAQVELEHPVFSEGESRIAGSGRFHFTEERVFAASVYLLHVFDYQGNCLEEYDLQEGWRFANFTVTPNESQIIVSATKRVESGGVTSLDFQTVFFDTDPQARIRAEMKARAGSEQKGEASTCRKVFDPQISQPDKAYFRNIFALPDGEILANIWHGHATPEKPSRTDSFQVLSLQKIRFLNRSDCCGQAPGYQVDFVGNRLYRRIFEPKSLLAANIRLIMGQSPDGNKLFFVHPMETLVRVVQRGKSGTFRRGNDLQLNLPNFKHVPDDAKDIRQEDVSVIEGFLCLPHDKILVVYRSDTKGNITMRLQDEHGGIPIEMDVPSSRAYVGASNNIAYFLDMEGNFSSLEAVDF